MADLELICGLPFYTPSRNWREFMNLGELVEHLIQLKKTYKIYYPDDNYINLACNIIESMPDKQITIDDLILEIKNKKDNIRHCIVYDKDNERKGVFHGFCDNNNKCVIEFEDGELHKAYVWKVKFTDDCLSIQ